MVSSISSIGVSSNFSPETFSNSILSSFLISFWDLIDLSVTSEWFGLPFTSSSPIFLNLFIKDLDLLDLLVLSLFEEFMVSLELLFFSLTLKSPSITLFLSFEVSSVVECWILDFPLTVDCWGLDFPLALDCWLLDFSSNFDEIFSLDTLNLFFFSLLDLDLLNLFLFSLGGTRFSFAILFLFSSFMFLLLSLDSSCFGLFCLYFPDSFCFVLFCLYSADSFLSILFTLISLDLFLFFSILLSWTGFILSLSSKESSSKSSILNTMSLVFSSSLRSNLEDSSFKSELISKSKSSSISLDSSNLEIDSSNLEPDSSNLELFLFNSSSNPSKNLLIGEFLFNSSSNPSKYLLIKSSFCLSLGDFSIFISSDSSSSALISSFILWILAKSLSTMFISDSLSLSSSRVLSKSLSSVSSSLSLSSLSFPGINVVIGLIFIDSTSSIFFFKSFTLVSIMVDSMVSNNLALAKSLFLYQSVDQIW